MRPEVRVCCCRMSFVGPRGTAACAGLDILRGSRQSRHDISLSLLYDQAEAKDLGRLRQDHKVIEKRLSPSDSVDPPGFVLDESRVAFAQENSRLMVLCTLDLRWIRQTPDQSRVREDRWSLQSLRRPQRHQMPRRTERSMYEAGY